jgi:hypothetical protein
MSTEIYSAMQTGRPTKSYQKTILGKVCVTFWDSFNNVPGYFILEGDPKKTEDGTVIDVWDEKEDVFFHRMNKSHFQSGILREITRANLPQEPRVEDSSDEELSKILKEKFFTIQSWLNKVDSEALIFRLLTIAREEEKSEKLVKAIEARLTEIQQPEYEVEKETAEEE